MITVTITDKLQEAGATAAAIDTGAESAQSYLQSVLESACLSYASQFSVDRVTSGEFVLRFTGEEFTAITEAAQTDESVAGFLAATRAHPTVRLADPVVAGGLAYLVSQGLLTQARADEVAFYPIPTAPAV